MFSSVVLAMWTRHPGISARERKESVVAVFVCVVFSSARNIGTRPSDPSDMDGKSSVIRPCLSTRAAETGCLGSARKGKSRIWGLVLGFGWEKRAIGYFGSLRYNTRNIASHIKFCRITDCVCVYVHTYTHTHTHTQSVRTDILRLSSQIKVKRGKVLKPILTS